MLQLEHPPLATAFRFSLLYVPFWKEKDAAMNLWPHVLVCCAGSLLLVACLSSNTTPGLRVILPFAASTCRGEVEVNLLCPPRSPVGVGNPTRRFFVRSCSASPPRELRGRSRCKRRTRGEGIHLAWWTDAPQDVEGREIYSLLCYDMCRTAVFKAADMVWLYKKGPPVVGYPCSIRGCL